MSDSSSSTSSIGGTGGASRIGLAPGVWVHRDHIRFSFSRSGGPGGQNVNKVNTKAELRVRAEDIQGLSWPARQRLLAQAASRITGEGDVLIVCGTERSQETNRNLCLEKLAELVARAAVEPKRRHKTRPTRGSRERRLESKRERSQKKQGRRDFEY